MPAERVIFCGIPFDEHSSWMRGPAKAPKAIRKVMKSGSSNLCSENGTDLEEGNRLFDAGDINIKSGEAYPEGIQNEIEILLKENQPLLVLGGDHSITYPVIRAYSKKFNDLNILHIDAHSDLYDSFDDNPYSHASPFARIMEEKLVKRLVQAGIRTLNPHQREQAEKFGVEIIEMHEFKKALDIQFDGPVYLSLDLDAFDPAYAPGVSHLEPGGMSIRDVIGLIRNLHINLIGADIVELNPDRDVNSVTAMVAFKMLKEIAAKMVG